MVNLNSVAIGCFHFAEKISQSRGSKQYEKIAVSGRPFQNKMAVEAAKKPGKTL